MVRHGIPTARLRDLRATRPRRKVYVEREGAPIVVKADGLAAGKGVVVASSVEEAHAAIDMMLREQSLRPGGRARGDRGVPRGRGGELHRDVSDGVHALPLATSQDHKRLRDGDQGPNTGGMGAYSPAPVVTPQVHARVMREIIMPAVQGMAKDGIPLRRLPVRRADDRRGGQSEDARVQLPHGRPGDAADHACA